MDTRRIKKLIELVKTTGIGELEVKSGDESVRISCQSTINTQPAPTPLTHTAHTTHSSIPSSITPDENIEVNTNQQNEGYTQSSPMVGTAYLSASPGSAPFVKVGDHVEIGETLCLIEAMKMFNKIEAEKSGTISARLIDNGIPVEFDQPLFIIDTNE
jgi:acetyl-CoA carboxylase biotin carboxyl carrier protein